MIKLQVQGLTKKFGSKRVFENLHLKYDNSPLGIAGANGSGKSTFLKCIAHLLRPNQGNIQWTMDNKELTADALQRNMGYAAPYINLYEELTCRENLAFLLKLRQSDKEVDLVYWLEQLQLGSVINQPFGKLSTGQKQRLRLASAVFHKPDILLLDEPGSNLDKVGRELISDISETYHSSQKMLIIASNSNRELDLCHNIFSVEEQKFV